MAETPEGHVESDQGNEATPTNNLGYELEEYTQSTPWLWIEQQRMHLKELEDMCLGLEQERAELEYEIACYEVGGHMRCNPGRKPEDHRG